MQEAVLVVVNEVLVKDKKVQEVKGQLKDKRKEMDQVKVGMAQMQVQEQNQAQVQNLVLQADQVLKLQPAQKPC